MRGGERYGAGRPAYRNKTTAHRSIDVMRWAREGMLRADSYFGWQWTRDGEAVASIGVFVNNLYSMTLKYNRTDNSGNQENISFPIRIEWTACNFGGKRPWFICPHCWGRAAKLYLSTNGWFCRKSLRLSYPSQSEDPMTRMHRRIERLESKLDYENEKPKGMHWNNYNRIIEKLNDTERRLDLAFMQRAASLFGQYPL